ncbi:MAG: hypothetical protein AB7E63_02790 [Parachlamydia sp.]
MPLILQCPLLEPIRNQFETKKQEHLTIISRLENAAKRQVRDSYKKLVACIKDSAIAKGQYVSKCLSKIDRLLNNAIEERYCAQKDYEMAHEYMKDVCCEIVEKGHGSLIAEFVDIASRDKQVINLEETRNRHQLTPLKKRDMASFTLIQEHYVKRIKFAPAITKLQEARFSLFDPKSEELWVVYHHLCIAHWAWNTSKSYFTDKSLKYETPLGRSKSIICLELHSRWYEMQAMKQRNYSGPEQSLFPLKRYKNHLLRLENHIARELFKHDPELYQNQSKNDVPYQYHLYLDYKALWFAIEWKKGQEPNCYLIAKPNDSSITHQFIQQISKAEAETMIKAPARSAADLMERSNLSGEIRKIFFGKPSTYEVKFNGQNVLGEATDGVNTNQLVKEVSELHQGYGSPEPPSFLLSKIPVKSTS